jgi:hypothetical protein
MRTQVVSDLIQTYRVWGVLSSLNFNSKSGLYLFTMTIAEDKQDWLGRASGMFEFPPDKNEYIAVRRHTDLTSMTSVFTSAQGVDMYWTADPNPSPGRVSYILLDSML